VDALVFWSQQDNCRHPAGASSRGFDFLDRDLAYR
jgi:hypothetical protein